jgi:crotonobetainyl-CoA:carnitine CoA-transferase CaiB-like acyl-CoA transferase
MTVDVINNWPLMVLPPVADKALQKEASLYFLSQNRQKPIIMDIKTERDSDILREKGAFIDIYI